MTALPWVLFSGAAYIAVISVIATWRQYGRAVLAIPVQLRFCLDYCETLPAHDASEWQLILLKLASLQSLVSEFHAPKWAQLRL